ncbi:hypothetical protein HY640_05250 [Candidatus Woesearchaeota archaeon]|nr:hypothetical protein [Candidatus Woesearchaeota archaeon]
MAIQNGFAEFARKEFHSLVPASLEKLVNARFIAEHRPRQGNPPAVLQDAAHLDFLMQAYSGKLAYDLNAAIHGQDHRQYPIVEVGCGYSVPLATARLVAYHAVLSSPEYEALLKEGKPDEASRLLVQNLQGIDINPEATGHALQLWSYIAGKTNGSTTHQASTGTAKPMDSLSLQLNTTSFQNFAAKGLPEGTVVISVQPTQELADYVISQVAEHNLGLVFSPLPDYRALQKPLDEDIQAAIAQMSFAVLEGYTKKLAEAGIRADAQLLYTTPITRGILVASPSHINQS